MTSPLDPNTKRVTIETPTFNLSSRILGGEWKLWLSKEGGEGMELSVELLDEYLEKLWHDHF